MRSVKFIVAAGAASLLSSMASAADMAIAPPPMGYAPPVADFGGWYLRGDIGFSNQRVDSIRNTNPIFYAGNLSFQETTGFDTGGYLPASVQVTSSIIGSALTSPANIAAAPISMGLTC